MKISKNGLNLIKQFEGCKLTAYKCPAGVWTIGYGTTGKIDGKAICEGMKITKAKAEKLLAADCVKFEKLVAKYDEKYHFNQNQFDALVSFAYNIGSIDQLTAKGTRSIKEISEKILAYNKAAGKELAGLTRRRKAEKALFDKVFVSESSSSSKNGVSSNKYVTVTANALNCRNKPNMSGQIVGVFKKGTKLELVKKTNSSWYQVKYRNVSGYCAAQYLKE